MSTSTIAPVKEKISKKKCKKNNLKKCTSFKKLNSLNTPTPIVTEYCVKLTEDTNIVMRRNKKKPSGVELKLKHKTQGIDFHEWARLCNAIELVSTVKDLLNGDVGKEEELKNDYVFIHDKTGVEDVDSLYNALNSLNEEAMKMTTE